MIVFFLASVVVVKKFEIKVDSEFLVTIMRTSSLPRQLLFKS